MKKAQLTGILGLSLLAVSTAAAQQPQQQGQAGPSAASENMRTLPKGADLKFKLQDQISSQSTKAGDIVKAAIDGNVKDASGAVLFPEGAEAELQVVSTPGGLALAIKSVSAVGQKYRLRSNPDYTMTGAQSGGAGASASGGMGGGGISAQGSAGRDTAQAGVSGGVGIGAQGGAGRDTAKAGVSGGIGADTAKAGVSGGIGVGAQGGSNPSGVSGGVSVGAQGGRDTAAAGAGVSGGVGVSAQPPQGGVSAQGGMNAQGGAQGQSKQAWNIFKSQDNGLGTVSGIKEPPVGADFVIPPGTTVKFEFGQQAVTVTSGS